MKFLAPLLLLGLSVALFFGFTDPHYQTMRNLQAEKNRYEEAVERSGQLRAVFSNLTKQYASFQTEDIARLEKALPETVDNVKLVIDISNIAAAHGLVIRNVDVNSTLGGESAGNQSGGDADTAPGGEKFGSVLIKFSVNAPYETFLAFLRDLERSLRIMDVVSLSFDATPDKNLYQFNVVVQTYWLKTVK